MNNVGQAFNLFYENNILSYINSYKAEPAKLILLIIDIFLVLCLIYLFVRMVRGSRVIVGEMRLYWLPVREPG